MYIDLVLCKHEGDARYFLFQAPKFSYLQAGQLVIVDTRRGEQEATVVNVLTVERDSREYKFIFDMCKVSEPLRRVLKEVAYKELVYGEE